MIRQVQFVPVGMDLPSLHARLAADYWKPEVRRMDKPETRNRCLGVTMDIRSGNESVDSLQAQPSVTNSNINPTNNKGHNNQMPSSTFTNTQVKEIPSGKRGT